MLARSRTAPVRTNITPEYNSTMNVRHTDSSHSGNASLNQPVTRVTLAPYIDGLICKLANYIFINFKTLKHHITVLNDPC